MISKLLPLTKSERGCAILFKVIKAVLAVVCLVILGVGFGVTVMQVPGDNVMVACNVLNGEYYAPPYVSETEYHDGLYIFMRLGEAVKEGYKINPEHRDEGYFTGADTPLLLHLLGWKATSEWGEDGNWGIREWGSQ